MIRRMGRCETKPAAAGNPQFDAFREFDLLAGALPSNGFFYQITARRIGEKNGQAQPEDCQPAAFLKIQNQKNEAKKVERRPEKFFPKKRTGDVEQRVRAAGVDEFEQEMVELEECSHFIFAQRRNGTTVGIALNRRVFVYFRFF